MLAKAIMIASEAFVDVLDKGGQPYILHCLHVMNDVKHKPEEYQIVAVLHDLLEDTPWTYHQLIEEGFSDEVVNAIHCMTHQKDESYADYVVRLSKNKIATRVKLADLKHNSDITRLKGIRDKDIERMKKYNKTYLFLTKVYKHMKDLDDILESYGG